MSLYGIEDLEPIVDGFLDAMRQRLFAANNSGELEEFLGKLGLRHLLCKSEYCPPEEVKYGAIKVLGHSMPAIHHLIGVAGAVGISKERLEFLDYSQIHRNDVSVWQYSNSIAAIMCGPIPHSGTGMGDATSIVTALEDPQNGYPPVVRMTASHGLKLTKSSFSEALRALLADDIVRPDEQSRILGDEEVCETSANCAW